MFLILSTCLLRMYRTSHYNDMMSMEYYAKCKNVDLVHYITSIPYISSATNSPADQLDLLVGLGVDPPAAVLGAGLDGLVARHEAEVGEVGARLALGGARRRGIEAGPGVEDEGTGGAAGGGGGVGLLAMPHLTLDL